MLKFIRKFQLIILAVGGSLLMVVFLLEPVLTSFQKSQLNRTVARLADGGKVTLLDVDVARAEIDLARRVAGVVFLPREANGLGLSPDDPGGANRHVYHWIMLSRMAEEAGLVGGAEDGRQLINIQIAAERRELIQRAQMAIMQGAMTPQEATEQIQQYETLRRSQLFRDVMQTAAYTQGATEDDIWGSLAKFMGAYRLLSLYQNAPAFSPAGAVAAMRELGDSVAVNAALIPGTLLAPEVPDPSEEELAAFFEARAGASPDEDEMGVGYVQPARVRLGWLVLSREDFNRGVEVDRVELQKMWRIDSEKPEADRLYPGDFASERARIEADYRRDRVDQLMVEADRVIRSEALKATRGLSREGGRMVLPEDWSQTGPRLDVIAEAVVTRLSAQGANVPTPTVEVPENRWFSGDELARVPGLGRAFYRVGSRTVLIRELPASIGEAGVVESINLQVGVPQVEPAAVDAEGNRYYLLVLEHRDAGPARSIEEAGRDRVLADYKGVRGFEMLRERLDELESAAAGEGGVRAAVDLAVEQADLTRVVRPSVYRNLRVSTVQVLPSAQSPSIDPQLNGEAFRDAVLGAAEGVDPLASPEEVAAEARAVAVALPKARAVAVARVVAPRPMTREDFQESVQMALGLLKRQEVEAALDETGAGDPFSFETLRERYGLVVEGNQDDV